MKYKFLFAAAIFLLVGWQPKVDAAYLFKNGKLIKNEEVATLSVQEHYALAIDAFQEQRWDDLVQQMLIVIKNFPSSPFTQEAYYYLGVGYFHLKEYEFANRFLTTYLKKQTTPKYFEQAIEYKYKIAQKYQFGAKKHILGLETLPKWLPASEEAIAIYDEVIIALPHHDLAARSLFGKAQLLLKDEEYKASVETYQLLIRRFPKHPLAIDSYIGIGQVYLVQSKEQYPDQDYLDLAEINLSKFRISFPGEERIGVAEEILNQTKEVFASDLYATARFYERTSKPHAAALYYNRILAKYPETQVAIRASKRLSILPASSSVQKTTPSVDPSLEQMKSIPEEKGPSFLNLPVQKGEIAQIEPSPEELN